MYDFYILGVVGQEPVLFDCSIMENIKYIYIYIYFRLDKKYENLHKTGI